MPTRVPHHRLSPVLLAVAAATILAGCTESKSVPARRLLTTITTSNKRLEAVAKNFSGVVNRRLKDRASDADLRAAVKTFRNATQRIRDDSEKWSIPKTPEARALVDIYRANLERRVEVIDDFGPQIVEIMANSLIGTRQKAEKKGSEQAEERRAEAGCHAGEWRFKIFDNALNGGIRAGTRFRQSADNLTNGRHHLHQADKGADETEQDQETGKVIGERALMVDRILHHAEQGTALRERDGETARFEQFLEAHFIDLPHDPRHPEHTAGSRGAFEPGGTDEIARAIQFIEIRKCLFETFECFHIIEQAE